MNLDLSMSFSHQLSSISPNSSCQGRGAFNPITGEPIDGHGAHGAAAAPAARNQPPGDETRLENSWDERLDIYIYITINNWDSMESDISLIGFKEDSMGFESFESDSLGCNWI